MTVVEFLENYNDLTGGRQKVGMATFLNKTLDRRDDYRDLIYDMMLVAAEYEENDYFGTEGLDV